MERARPHKRRRGARSCLACRKAKQRCDLPEDAAIIPSEQPQPISTSCHRCKMLKQQCIIIDPPKELPTIQAPRIANNLSPPSAHASNGHISHNAAYRVGFHDEPHRSTPTTPQGQYTTEKSPNSISHDLQIFEPFAGQASGAVDDTPDTSHRSSEIFHDNNGDRRKMISPANSSHHSSNTKGTPVTSELPSWAHHAMLAFKPLRLLSELCWRLPAFHADQSSAQKVQHNAASDFVMRYADQKYDMMQSRLHDMRHFIPEMISLDELRQRQDPSMLLTTLAFTTSQPGPDQDCLKALVADLALNAILQGAADLEEICALILLGLYCPTLLLSRSSSTSRVQSSASDSTGPSLDGLGLFTSAASAANALDISQAVESIPTTSAQYQQRQEDWFVGSMSSLRKASAWLTLGIQAIITVLASDIKRKPFAECSMHIIEEFEKYCQHERTTSAPENVRQMLSRLLIDIFRYRYWNETLSRGKAMLSEMVNAEYIKTDVVERWIKIIQTDTQRFRIEALRMLRDDLYKLDYQDEESLEWLDLEISQMYFLSTTQLQAKLMESVSHLMVQATSSTTFLKSLLRDPILMPRFVLGGGAHNNAAKRYASLLATFGDRREGKSQWSPPPVLVCACAVLSAKILAEEIAGRFSAGHNPIMEMDDNCMEMAVVMSHSMARVLLQYSSTTRLISRDHKACDIFAATSIATRRTADAIDEWACTAKSLRFAHMATSRQSATTSSLEQANVQQEMSSIPQGDISAKEAQSTNASYSNGFDNRNSIQFGSMGMSFGLDSTLATEDDLDRLLREILSTPIDQYLLPDGSV